MRLSRVIIVATVASVACLCVSGTDTCTPRAATVTFSASCTSIDPANAGCWSPYPPKATDAVLFPSGTKATWHPGGAYTPLIVESVTVAQGATVVLAGGGVQATACFLVRGTLSLRGSALSSVPQGEGYRVDPTTPEGTDCAYVSRGFTPRVCGPGPVVVTQGSTVSAEGLYASIFAGVLVESGATLTLGSGAFLWGNTTVRGTLAAKGQLYLHGFLFNYGTAFLGQVRSDYWHTFYARPKPIVVHNVKGAIMNITWSIATDIPSYYKRVYPTYRLSLLNDGLVTFYNAAAAVSGVDIVNAGTTRWIDDSGYFPGSFIHEGTAENFGTFIADFAVVTLSSYGSHNGHLVTQNQGAFQFDNGAGVDESVVDLCRKRRDAHRTKPLLIPLKETPVMRSNVSCAKHGCPANMCCGKDLVCETPRCHCEYGGGPVCCCVDNAPCGGSSHGPYCGGGFGWDVDADCMASIDHVDRLQFDQAMAIFGRPLPRGGPRQRFSMRGNTTLGGDGVVRFGQPVSLSGRLHVERGATLRLLMEHGAVALPGRALVEIDGTLSLGIRTRLSPESASVALRPGGVLRIPRACAVDLSTAANITIPAGATLHIDGQLMIREAHVHATSLCGTTTGRGAIIGPVDNVMTCHTHSG